MYLIFPLTKTVVLGRTLIVGLPEKNIYQYRLFFTLLIIPRHIITGSQTLYIGYNTLLSKSCFLYFQGFEPFFTS